MSTKKLKGKKIAILATNGFEESELKSPAKAIEEAGGTYHVVSPEIDTIEGWKDGNWSGKVKVDRALAKASPGDYDGLVIPGGVINPDILRKNVLAVEFVSDFFQKDRQRPVAAICHGPQLLIETKRIDGRKLTSYNSIRSDLQNAGAVWSDEEVVVDNGLVTSRSPDDLPAFNDKMVEEFCEGPHSLQK